MKKYYKFYIVQNIRVLSFHLSHDAFVQIGFSSSEVQQTSTRQPLCKILNLETKNLKSFLQYEYITLCNLELLINP